LIGVAVCADECDQVGCAVSPEAAADVSAAPVSTATAAAAIAVRRRCRRHLACRPDVGASSICRPPAGYLPFTDPRAIMALIFTKQ
jgi:hypothetical protein